MNIKGYDKAEILKILYDNSHPLGLGILHFRNENMTIEEARKLLKEETCFDYLAGRVMKIDLSSNELRTDLYNRDNGPGRAEELISKLEKNNG